MADEEWWRDESTRIGHDGENDGYVENLHARFEDGEWEYALVRWRLKTPLEMWTLRGGQLLEPGIMDPVAR